MSQQQASNPLSASDPWNLVADGYTETTMRVFEQFADEAMLALFRKKIEQAGHHNIALHYCDADPISLDPISLDPISLEREARQAAGNRLTQYQYSRYRKNDDNHRR